ncbi:MAG TPA: MarR family transcriptional regulator [Caulobacteraceae bacterium]|nr:MarR family transcriptional regulator [Caulobacteraceae bacterium]
MVDLNRQAALRDAIELLYFGYRAFTDGPDRILARRGLGRVHHRILYFVGRNPGVTVGGLLDILAVSKQALNAPLRQLVEMGLVVLTANADDRRIRNLGLTDAGRRLEAELTGAQTRLLEAAMEQAGPDAEAGWRAVMAAMSRA